MQDPIKPPSDDVIMLGKLPADDFEASVSRAREAARARMGLPSDTRPQFETAVTRPAGPTPVPAPGGAHAASPHAAPATVTQMPTVPKPVAPIPATVPQVHSIAAARPAAAPTPVVLTASTPHPATSTASAASALAETPAIVARRSVRISLPLVGVGLLLLAAIGGAVLYFQLGGLPLSAAPTPAPTTGTVHIVSRPAGANVIVDGVSRGVAPIDLTLAPGQHTLEVQSGTTKRVLPLAVDAGTIVRQYVDFGTSAATAVGRLEITSDPPGAHVTVDGSSRGSTPLIVADVAPGSHTVAIGSGDAAVLRTVEVAAGTTASVVVSIAPTEGAAGWVALKAPFAMEMREGERMLAAAGVDRVMLPTGRHNLELVANEFEFRTTVTVNVQAGRTATANVIVPNGKLSINAAPWADVWLDGKEMGTTPLGNLSVPIGTHEIVWKHPQLGERRQVVKVLAQTPVRASMDFGK